MVSPDPAGGLWACAGDAEHAVAGDALNDRRDFDGRSDPRKVIFLPALPPVLAGAAPPVMEDTDMSHHPTRPLFQVSEGEDGTTVRLPAGTVLTDGHVEAIGRHPLAAGRGDRPLTLDLAGVDALSSAALGKLLALNLMVRATGGRLALTNPSAAVRRVFRIARLDALLDIRAPEPLPV